MALTSQTPQPPNFRLLLDQGFPNPPGFTVRSIDNTVEVVHLSQFDRTLSQRSTPDWVLYCIAARAGFDAFVTRDQAQTNQLVEMYVLSRLRGFTIITWKKPIEDPVREWDNSSHICRRLRNDSDSVGLSEVVEAKFCFQLRR